MDHEYIYDQGSFSESRRLQGQSLRDLGGIFEGYENYSMSLLFGHFGGIPEPYDISARCYYPPPTIGREKVSTSSRGKGEDEEGSTYLDVDGTKLIRHTLLVNTCESFIDEQQLKTLTLKR
jgi:hypothetical protein